MRNLILAVVGIFAGMLLSVAICFAAEQTFTASARTASFILENLPSGMPMRINAAYTCYDTSQTPAVTYSGRAVVRTNRGEQYVACGPGSGTHYVYGDVGADGKLVVTMSPVDRPGYIAAFSAIVVSDAMTPEIVYNLAFAGVVSALLLWGAVIYNQ